jgi:APA family basic amino acid/polyamine antiporter
LMFSLPAENWFRLIGWLVLGIAIYFGYGKHHSVLARMRDRKIPAGSRPA